MTASPFKADIPIQRGGVVKKIFENFQMRGVVEVFTSEGKPELIYKGHVPCKNDLPVFRAVDINFPQQSRLVDYQKVENVILYSGKDRVIESLTTGFVHTIARMAIGDRGAIPSDQTVPKVPTSDLEGLYNEVYRADVDAVVLDTGGGDGTHEVKFIKTFSAVDIPLTSYSNQATPIINEVSLITADLLAGNPLPRPPVAAPNTPDGDESFFSLRTFKSVPFEASNEISITIRYTIFIA